MPNNLPQKPAPPVVANHMKTRQYGLVHTAVTATLGLLPANTLAACLGSRLVSEALYLHLTEMTDESRQNIDQIITSLEESEPGDFDWEVINTVRSQLITEPADGMDWFYTAYGLAVPQCPVGTDGQLAGKQLDDEAWLMFEIRYSFKDETQWDSLLGPIRVSVVGDELVSTVEQVDRDGVHNRPLSDQTLNQVQELRQLMYRRDSGTWFTMELDQTSATFYYDSVLDQSDGFTSVEFVRDQQQFPRTQQYQPVWLRRAIGS